MSRNAALGFLALFTFASAGTAQDLGQALATENARHRATIDSLSAGPLVDGDRPRIKGLLDDIDSLLKAKRLAVALETLASAAPGTTALARAAGGWDDTGKGSGKHIDALTREWEELGRTLKADRGRFPAAKPAGQTAFLRATAEQSFGQIDEHYAVAVDYGRVSGVSSGAYYLGRAEGHLAFALFVSRLTSPSVRSFPTIASLKGPIAALENDIVTAYAKPGSTSQHTNFILANSSLKLSKELDQHGWRLGAMVTMLRSLFALTLATVPAPASGQEDALASQADGFEKQFAASGRDDTIGEAFVEKARIAIEKSRAGGDGAERERLRAAALLGVVVPRYIEIMKGFLKND